MKYVTSQGVKVDLLAGYDDREAPRVGTEKKFHARLDEVSPGEGTEFC